MSKKILFLTTANLSMKPRLVKEIQLAQSMGMEVDLIAFKINNWTDQNHDKLATELGINNHTLYATKQNFSIWFLASILQIAALKIWKLFPNNMLISAFASNKRSIMLLLFLLFSPRFKRYERIIGRNTATIFPILYFRKRFQGSIAFDVEDFHPGEKVSWCNPVNEEQRRILLMNTIFKCCDYISFAGAPIMNKVIETFPAIKDHPILINLPNSFPSSEFLLPEKLHNSNKIELVWFSVDISANRGLEQLIEALASIHENFHLTLYGTQIKSFYEEWIKPNNHFITVKKPVIQSELHNQLPSYDIGLALEISKTDINKQLAISNKLYAYLQTGLFVLATDTLGHKQLLATTPHNGIICRQTVEAMSTALRGIKDQLIMLRENKLNRFKKGKELAWEKEARKLQGIWQHMLEN